MHLCFKRSGHFCESSYRDIHHFPWLLVFTKVERKKKSPIIIQHFKKVKLKRKKIKENDVYPDNLIHESVPTV